MFQGDDRLGGIAEREEKSSLGLPWLPITPFHRAAFGYPRPLAEGPWGFAAGSAAVPNWKGLGLDCGNLAYPRVYSGIRPATWHLHQ
jgi:hypothetical protein